MLKKKKETFKWHKFSTGRNTGTKIYFKIYKKLETFSFDFSINSIYHPPEMDILEGINSAYVL